MPLDSLIGNIFGANNASFGIKAFVVLFVFFYVFFALILFRQIQLMTHALPTIAGPFLKFVAIVQIGISLALLSIVIGAF